MRILFFLFFSLSVFARENVEFFVYYLDQLKGREIFETREDTTFTRLDQIFSEKGLYIESLDKDVYLSHYKKKSLFSSWNEFLRKVGFKERVFEHKKDVRYYLFWGVGVALKKLDFSKLPKEKLVLFLWEPPAVEEELFDPKFLEQFHKVFTWKDDLVDHKKFIKFHYPVLQSRIKNLVPFEKKKLCVLMNTRLSSKYKDELYSEREKAIQFFEDKEGEFDLFGRKWEKREYKNYQGVAGDKIQTIKNYKFCICYENTQNIEGYITEKIFDCFAAGCVPIYWGASNISSYIPEGCFIDRRKFASMEEVYEFMTKMNEEDYDHYLEQAKHYIESEKAKAFTLEALLDVMRENL